MNEITLKLPDEQAVALAQLCKRISYEDVRSNAVNGSETGQMIAALGAVQKALSDNGFTPR